MKLTVLAAIAATIVLFCSVSPSIATTQSGASIPPQNASAGEAGSEELDNAIQEVIRQREYQWRLPREVVDDDQQNLLIDLFEALNKAAKRVWKPIAEVWSKVNRWLRRQMSSLGPRGSGREWTAGEMNVLIVTLVTLLVLVILFFAWRHRKSRRQADIIAAEAIHPVPDLADENVIADQLPEEGWQKLAQDLLSRGELRLALRALFMASLAHLAKARLITIARFKSNREYLQELERRGYDRTEIQKAFNENVNAIDCVWYGMYPVTDDLLERFRYNVEFVTREAL
jgi:hypothetical protein